jgi:hypothetical protein
MTTAAVNVLVKVVVKVVRIPVARWVATRNADSAGKPVRIMTTPSKEESR